MQSSRGNKKNCKKCNNIKQAAAATFQNKIFNVLNNN